MWVPASLLRLQWIQIFSLVSVYMKAITPLIHKPAAISLTAQALPTVDI